MPPTEFLKRLEAFDPTLTVVWNTRKGCWVIEQCIEHLAAGRAHTHLCRRIYVWLMPQGMVLENDAAIFEELARRDTRRAGYEPGPKGLEAFKADMEYLRQRDEAKREAALVELPRLARKDNFLSMNRAQLLIEKHIK